MRLFYDTETTGLPRWDLPADHKSQPRLVELAALLCDDEGNEAGSMDVVIRPDGWTIPEGASRVHGITDDVAIREGIPVAEALDMFDAMLRGATELLSYGIRFDDKILRGERRRLGRPDGFGQVPVFCILKGATPCCAMPATDRMKSYGGELALKNKPPKLGEAIRILFGEALEGAHRALVDCRAAKRVYYHLRADPRFLAAGREFSRPPAPPARPADAAAPRPGAA